MEDGWEFSPAVPQSRRQGCSSLRVVTAEGAGAISYSLAIDQGTHASRAILFDERGQMVAEATEEIDLITSDGGIEQNPEQILASVKKVVGDVLAGLSAEVRGKVSCCGLACQRSTVVPWQSDGTALANALSWQDVRAADQVALLRSKEVDVRRISGLPLSPHYGASKLRWLLQNSAAVRGCTRERLRLSPLVSYLLFHLLEEKPYIVDDANAQRSQLFDVATRDWSEELTTAFEVPLSYLPRCVPVSATHGVLEGSHIPMTAVSGDQNAAFFGAGDMAPNTALVNIGSGAFILRPLEGRSASDKQLTGIAHSDGNATSYLREATVNGAGNALNWAQVEWDIPALFVQLPHWLDQIDDPPVFINSIGGLAAPWWREDVVSHFLDGGEKAKDADRVVAVVESIVFSIGANLELMQAELPLQQLRVSGGLSQLDGLCQKIADLGGLPVARSDASEATARGIAWLAAGRPRRWNQDTSAVDPFLPQPNPGLDKRFERFKMALEEIPEEKR
ncbi:MAG TPA: hypothetical protein EYN79_01200 [Planctomycetes bacterium]|nr:hypothetical protein [Planctomycetota bacterium]HIN79618.1 hypothetical protein [Planctomycetota bacterium]